MMTTLNEVIASNLNRYSMFHRPEPVNVHLLPQISPLSHRWVIHVKKLPTQPPNT